MHWHSPSEHQIDGVQYAAELHLVHLSDSGTIAVVSMLYELGDADPFISKITNRLSDLAKDASAGYEEAHIPIGALDNKLLRKNTRKYYRYVGSLTVPPCTEKCDLERSRQGENSIQGAGRSPESSTAC
ncbi:hypothetical protein OIU76_021078 [Salix suchowensis]|nr:hypothetical protein OIU76_021078 [Salix suchowensis]